MPIEFRIDKERKLIVGRGYGAVSHKDLLDIVNQMVMHPDYKPSFNEIWDIREVDDLVTLFEQTSERVENELSVRKLNKPNREAIVVSNTVQYGSAMQYAALAQKIPLVVEVFYDYDIALEWVMNSHGTDT